MSSLFLYVIAPLIFVGIAFLASLTIYFWPAKELYLRWFPLFLLFEGGVSGWADYEAMQSKNNILLSNLLTAGEFTFYLFVLYGIIQRRTPRRLLFYGIPIYLGLSLVNIFLVQMVDFHSMTYCLGCLLIAIFCIYYFWELFQLPHSVNLLGQPAFWICSGLLFYALCCFPIYGLLNFISRTDDSLAGRLTFISNLVYIFLFISFTIAFLCRLKTRKSMSSF